VRTLSTQHLDDSHLDCAALNSKLDSWCNLSNSRSRALVMARLTSLGLQVELESSDTHPVTTNVVAELRGTSKPDEVVMIAAHFDAFYSGADDNSSGVAAMLEVARLLANRPLARTVRFTGFDLEEIGLVGSTRHVATRAHPKASLVFDCIGYSDTKPGSQSSLPGFPTPSAGDFLAEVRRQMRRRVRIAPVLTRKLAPMPLQFANPVWVEEDRLEWAYHVQHITLEPPGTQAQLEELAGRLHSELLDRHRPLWRMAVIDGLASGQVAYYFQIHHAVLDGQAGVLLAQALFDVTPKPRATMSTTETVPLISLVT